MSIVAMIAIVIFTILAEIAMYAQWYLMVAICAGLIGISFLVLAVSLIVQCVRLEKEHKKLSEQCDRIPGKQ